MRSSNLFERRRPTLLLLAFGLVVSCLHANDATGQEWTRFRGPNGTGVSKTVFADSFKPSDFAWNVKLPGIGHSSPVVWGDRVFLLSADPQTATRHMLCINAKTGKTIWTREYESEAHHLHTRSSFASCTPTVDSERVYVAWSTPKETTLLALDHDGKDVWRINLGRWVSQHGFGTSPMLYKDLIILNNSQQANQLKEGVEPGKSFMMAFNRKTGKEVWRTPRKSVNVCYSVPCIYTPEGGKPELLHTTTGNGVYSLDPLTGKENWAVADAIRLRCVSSPIVAGGLVFGSTGSGGGGNYVVAVKPGKEAEVVYKVEQPAPYVPSILNKNGTLFLWWDKGVVQCIDAATGDRHYRQRIGGGFSCSPILAGDKVYCIREDGVLITIAAEKKFRLLGESPLGEDSRATPAVSGNRMFLRTNSRLICVEAEAT